MKTRTMVTAIAVATGLFVTGAVAQHEEHHQGQAAQPPAAAADKGDSGKSGGMMSGNMMSQMPKMMMGQNDTGKLVDQLMTSFAAIQAENDPTALKEKLAEHGSLLKELQTRVQTQSHMMDMMRHMMGGSMMGDTTTGAEPTK
ncbi:MAG TPA: hypothetical protein VGR73_10540 [Bryobacteraceae bacterium]|nr:hypothetical protein [Bryobacteraceae bacterium]